MLDLILENACVVDVVRQRTFSGWLGVRSGRFIYVEEGTVPAEIESHRRRDLEGRAVQPGLIDTHMHIESSLVTPGRFAEAALPWGTTTILQDPHEIGNVLGAAGVRFMIEAGRDLPLHIYSAVPSCVPATSEELETPNATLTPEEVAELARDPSVIALGEMMDYQRLLQHDPRLIGMLEAGATSELSLEGHVPSLSGTPLSHYISFGIRSDHTLMTPAKIGEELSKGLYVMLQAKSLTEENLRFISGLADRSRLLLITDDIMPNRLVSGHLNQILQLAVDGGWDALDALASATVRPATYLGLRSVGVIAPGYRADFCICRTPNSFPPLEVFTSGQQVAADGRALFRAPQTSLPPEIARASLGGDSPPLISEDLFRLELGSEPKRVRIITVNDLNTVTGLETRTISTADGAPLDPDLAVGTVIPRASLRQKRLEKPRLSLLSGLHLTGGAFASSFAHDSHNLLVVGTSPAAMAEAANAVLARGGGMAVASKNGVTALSLPLAGLLSDAPITEVASEFEALEEALRNLGMRHKNPLLLLTILPLTVSPNYKISDRGMIDVEGRKVLELTL
ncbi:MAG: adenine deaminase [Trueperaceae bacterium]|nr:MAG: adenine deaminase [Trueperaceae bacterium]